MYVRDNYTMKPLWSRINKILIAGMTCIAFFVSLGTDDFSMYAGASISCLTLLFLLWAFAIFHFWVDSTEIDDRPVYYSMTLFPIFKYDPKKNDLEDHYVPSAVWTAGIIILFGWTFLTAHQMRPEWIGPCILCLVLDLVILSLFYT